MKKLTAILAALLLAALAVPLAVTAGAVPAEPAAADIGETVPEESTAPLANPASDFTYTVANGKVTITGYTGKSLEAVIPAKIGGYPVTAIADRAFYARYTLTDIVLPDSVTSIGDYAFFNCHAPVAVPAGVTSIGEHAFDGCGMTSVTIPAGVTTLGDYAFTHCYRLAEVSFNAVNLSSSRAFDEAGGDDGVRVTFGKTVKQIPAYLFCGCSKLISAALPDSVTSIGEYAFWGCRKLTSFTIPGSVTSLGAYAFSGSGLTTVTIPAGVTEIREGTFFGCEFLTSAVIPAGVTSLEEGAFSSCISLTTAVIPEGVTSIGRFAFHNTSLTAVTIPKNVTSIGECAFDSCNGLTEIVYNAVRVPDITLEGVFGGAGSVSGGTSLKIGTTVERIPAYMFRSCPGLTTVTIPDSVTEIGDHAFLHCGHLTTVKLPGSLTSLRDGIFYGCYELQDVVIPAGVRDIGQQAFYECRSLTAVTIPQSVTSIGKSAFQGCFGLTSVTFSEGLKSLGEYAFADCWSLTSVTLPEGLTSIERSTFENCRELASAAIPDGVKLIGALAFRSCGLTEVTMPQSVTHVGQGSFSGCGDLTDVWYGGRETRWLSVSVGTENYPLLSAEFHFAEIPPEITLQPSDQNVPAGSAAVFTVTAEGTHLTYQWQYSENGGESWISCDSAESVAASFRFTVSESLDGRLYRCVVTDEYGTVTSDAAKLTVCAAGTEGVPEFRTQSLILSGEIGVNFYMDLSQIPEEMREESCVEFTVGKSDPVKVPFDADKINSKGYFGFTCYVKSIQMADTIRAVYHYGDGKTISKEYSVLRYIQAVEKNASGFDARTLALVRSIADFGHHAQIYLAEVNGWTIGDKYAEMSRHFTDIYYYDDILSVVQENAFVTEINGTNITKATYKLHLDAETTVDVLLTTKDGKAPANVTLTIHEEETGKENTKKVTPVKQSDGRYLIRIPGISAHKLGDMITITGTAGKTFTVRVSALSYVRSVLNNFYATTAAKNCLASLYMYYADTMAYRE